MTTQAWTVGPDARGASLIDFLASRLDCSKKRAKAHLDRRCVFVDDRRVWMARHRLQVGNRVELAAPAARAAKLPAPLFRDEHFLIANKPPNVMVTGDPGLEAELREQFALPGLAAVHRLDRETSGCLMLAVDDAAKERAEQLFKSRVVDKAYRAIVHGNFPRHLTCIRRRIDGQTATTHIRVVASNATASLLAVRIETGRTHQIRKHLSHAGHPVLGDKAYAGDRRLPGELKAIARHMLHAQALSFRHPFTEVEIKATAPLPADFRDCLRRLRLARG